MTITTISPREQELQGRIAALSIAAEHAIFVMDYLLSDVAMSDVKKQRIDPDYPDYAVEAAKRVLQYAIDGTKQP